MRRAHLLGLCALLIFVGARGQASAQTAPPAPAAPAAVTAPTPADLAAAKTESDLGARLFAERIYEGALPHFKKAYELAHKPADLQKIAESYRGMGEQGLAYDTFTKLLTVHGAALGAQTAPVKKAIAELDKTTGLLMVHCSADGASVRVGDRFVGVTPLAAPVRLAAGATHAEFSKEGFEPVTSAATIDPAHAATVDATLVPHVVMGHLAVTEVHAAQARLLLDGQDVGALPWEGDVPAGTHQLGLQGDTVEAAPRSVIVHHGTRVTTTLAGTIVAQRVQINAKPESAAIEVDGKPVGTGHFDGNVKLGDHLVRVSAKGYATAESHATVDDEQTVSLRVTLKRVISAEEVAAARAAEESATLRGGYGTIALWGAFAPLSTHLALGETAPADSGATQTNSPGFPLGGGLAARGGYSLGAIGFEAIGIFMANHWEDDLSYNQPGQTPSTTTIGGVGHSETYSYTVLGGLVGAGVRLATDGRRFRFTIGAGGGASIRHFQLDRSLSNGLTDNQSAYSQGTVVVSPAVTGDIGVIIGSTPGANFVLGVMTWVDFPTRNTQLASQNVTETPTAGSSGLPSSIDTTAGPFTIVAGPQVFVGPYLGIRFGH